MNAGAPFGAGVAGPTVVPVGEDYEVVVGRGLLATVVQRVPQVLSSGAERVVVVHTGSTARYAGLVADGFRDHGIATYLEEVPDAEAAKTAAETARLWGRLGQLGLTRSDAVVGVGGGAVTDLAGFVAATWLRGVQVVQVPTTLLGMVDAAVGGKTGINTAEGKNLVGSFHPPAVVVCDLDTLLTLPRDELVSGMAEVVKHGLIADERTVHLVEAGAAAALDPAGPVLAELVERSVAVKAGVVAQDLRESWLREILNYGHTLGHAIEQVEHYTLRHGTAVSVGLVYAAELARLSGLLDTADVERHRELLTSVGLPVRDRGDRWPALLDAMRRDKKARGSRLRFVVLDGIGNPTRLEDPPGELLEQAYAAVSATGRR